jgi:hypothetical protein
MMKKEWPSYPIASTSLREFITAQHPASRPNMMVSHLSGATLEEIDADPRAALESAKYNLSENVAVVGLTEKFDESLILMKRRLNWSHFPYYVTSRVGRRKNKSKRRDERSVSKRTASFIREENALDVALYRHARQHFEEMVEKEGSSLQADVERFQSVNRWFASLAAGPLWLYRKGRRLIYEARN